jgi:hypothetical protein
LGEYPLHYRRCSAAADHHNWVNIRFIIAAVVPPQITMIG